MGYHEATHIGQLRGALIGRARWFLTQNCRSRPLRSYWEQVVVVMTQWCVFVPLMMSCLSLSMISFKETVFTAERP